MRNLTGMFPTAENLFKGARRAGGYSFDEVAKYERAMAGGAVARSSGGRGFGRRARRYAVRGGLVAGAGAGLYGLGRSSGVNGITPQASGSGGYPTGMYGM